MGYTNFSSLRFYSSRMLRQISTVSSAWLHAREPLYVRNAACTLARPRYLLDARESALHRPGIFFILLPALVVRDAPGHLTARTFTRQDEMPTRRKPMPFRRWLAHITCRYYSKTGANMSAMLRYPPIIIRILLFFFR